jgi:dsRNA-specific ribonuclease
MPEPSESTLATTLCAIIGALGQTTPDRASLLVHDFLISQLTETSIADLWAPTDAWKSLEEILSRDKKASPEARLAFEDGSGTLLAVYCVVIFSDKVMLGKGMYLYHVKLT